VGFLDRLLGRSQPNTSVSLREMATQELRAAANEDHEELVEIVEIVGESYRQDALASLAGQKDAEGKHKIVGAVLRCEPKNEHDANAIRAEVMGKHVGYVSRETAKFLSPAIQQACGGALEARGLIVGGWKSESRDDHGRYVEVSEGSYGIRIWITEHDAERLGMRPDALDPGLRPHWPDAPQPVHGEQRLSPTKADVDAGRYGSVVTVTCEEHYQNAIEAAMPPGWDPQRTWPLLVDLAVAASNPHTKRGTPCIEVRSGDRTIGYLTPKMSDRHMAPIQACVKSGRRATATATASRGSKGGLMLWRIKVQLRE
jgi:HIRAN domain